MNRFDLQHYIVNRSINQTCNDKSKVGLPSVNITLRYAMTTSTPVDLQRPARSLKRQFYMVSLEGLDSCTLLLDSSLLTNVVRRDTRRKNCKLCLKSLVLCHDNKRHTSAAAWTNTLTHTPALTKRSTIRYTGMWGHKYTYRGHYIEKKKNDETVTHDDQGQTGLCGLH